MKPLLVSLSLAATICWAAMSLSAAPSVSDYGSLPSVSMMKISPDGEKIAFRKVGDATDQVLVISLEDGRLLNRLEVEEVKPRSLYFIGNDLLVLVASEYKGIWGSNLGYELSTAFGFDLETGRLQQLLTPGDVISAGQSGLGDVVGVSEDFRYAFMPAFVPEKDRRASFTLRSGDGTFSRFSLMKVDLEDPGNPEVYIRGSESTKGYLIDEENDLVVEEAYNDDSDLHTFRVHRGSKSKILIQDERSVPELSMHGFSPDRKAVLVSEEDRFFFVDLETGEQSDPDLPYREGSVSHVVRTAGGEARGLAYQGFRPTYSFWDQAFEERFEKIQALFPKHSVWLSGTSADWKRLIVYVEGNGSSGEYFLFSEGESPRLIAQARPSIGPEDVNPVIEYEYAARDGLRIPTLLTVPRSRVEDPSNLPAVMFPHGGPAAYDRFGFDWLAQAMASRGYLVVQPQFRGSTGFGLAHEEAGHGEWGRRMQDDLTDGIEALIKRGMVDPERVAIVGASYGGYAALAGAAFTPERYRCAVSIGGVADLPRMFDDDRFLHGSSSWILDYWTESVLGDERSKETLREVSPVFSAAKVQAPVLLIHGKDDSVVPFDQAKAMQRALAKAGKQVRLVKLDGEDHYLTRSATRIQCMEALMAFLEKRL
ncbi:alpha/beta fold hydrolase [Pelagicoccus sp. SDUM812003]|uniref:alpha/beta hydrolase family protein n=1 Tax=Pelagicoccus sp. SDUM812003 TaxID=3041267 RepID=UPI002810546F|nr:alpha/beta fold hydrolase [Pelagicoccus sp. SDUM812003]MDQ8204114.1 prolyl oligopeptidase family serine peptidase [Pelagicoccus sp. SDUM812003]